MNYNVFNSCTFSVVLSVALSPPAFPFLAGNFIFIRHLIQFRFARCVINSAKEEFFVRIFCNFSSDKFSRTADGRVPGREGLSAGRH